ncbi:MAG: ribokinase [Corynebacterium sp.]|nr:ribokinase [Corynebacterium sp.]
MSGLVVVGSINADLVARVDRHPNPGETLLGTGGHVTAGGKGANQAVAAAFQGAEVHFVGAVGSDAYVAPATKYLELARVNLEAVAHTAEPTGLAIITVSADGENSIVVIPGANATVDAAYVRSHEATLAAAELVLLQGEIPRDGIEAAIAIAVAHHVPVVVNLAPVIAVDIDILVQVDTLIANEHEAALILHQFGITSTPQEPTELIAKLQEVGFSTVVLTLGAAGSLVATDSITEIPALKVATVDTTGAGDAFAGALSARLIAGDSIEDAARYATRVSAVAVQSPGAQAAYPTSPELLPQER